MKLLFLPLLLLASGFSSVATATGNTFDPVTNTLTMDSVTVTGDRTYSNVVIRIDQFTVLGVGSSAPDNNPVSETCGSGNFTIDKLNAIQVGMSIDQVNQVMGCKFDPAFTLRFSDFEKRYWNYEDDATFKFITVTFNSSDLTVTGSLGSAFKASSGF